MRNDKLVNERNGIIGSNNYGSIMEVVDYKNTLDVLVKFLDHGNLVNVQWNDFIKGKVRNVYDKSVYGIGYIGEGNYKTRVNGKNTNQYNSWHSMMQRCYSSTYHKNRPTYIDCSVSEEWHNFQTFARWYDDNYYEVDDERIALDKDILVKGNKIYSPETCIFVPQRINILFIKNNNDDLPNGVYLNKKNSKYIARCENIKGQTDYLGSFVHASDAFFAYVVSKEKLIKQIAELYRDRIPSTLYKVMITYKIN